MISGDTVLHAVPALLVGTTASLLVLAMYTAAVFVVMCYTFGQFHLLYFYLRRQTTDGGGRTADGTRRVPAMMD
ncbi:MAG: hypothetical protein ACHQQR_12325, partial [Gemmatimonadales bacterium]